MNEEFKTDFETWWDNYAIENNIPADTRIINIAEGIYNHFTKDKEPGLSEIIDRALKSANRDAVITPTYYNGDDVMKIIERYNLSFCLGNSIKYVLRSGKKVDSYRLNKVASQKEFSEIISNSTTTDLKKAQWYLAREIANLEKESE